MVISRELVDALPPGVVQADGSTIDTGRLFSEALECVREVDPDLDLSSTVGLYVQERYADALACLSSAVGRQITATNNQDGTGYAMVHHEPDGEHFAVSMEVLLGAFSPQEKLRALMRNVLHHELCHIHDGAVHRRNVPGVCERSLTLPDWKTAWLWPFGHDIWAEYYADRRSHSTRPRGENRSLPSLEAAVARFPDEVHAAMGDLNDATPAGEACRRTEGILRDVAPPLENLCKHIGYVMGTHAGSVSSASSSPLSVSGTAWLSTAWSTLERHLDFMYQEHGRWAGIQVFWPLLAAVEQMLEGAGMKLLSVFGRPLVLPA